MTLSEQQAYRALLPDHSALLVRDGDQTQVVIRDLLMIDWVTSLSSLLAEALAQQPETVRMAVLSQLYIALFDD